MDMSSSSPRDAASLPRRSRRREWLGLALVIALPVGLLVAAAASISHFVNRDWDQANAAADQELNEAIADADRLDPGWLWDELIARRKSIPDQENGSLLVDATSKLLPRNWPGPPYTNANEQIALLQSLNELAHLEEALRDLPPERQLDAEQIKQLRENLRLVAPAVPEARKLADRPEGRYPLTINADFISTVRPCLDNAFSVARLLNLDATLLAQDYKPDQALISVRAILNVGRYVGDEPTLGSQQSRLSCRKMATVCLERVLAQGEPSDEALTAVQQLLVEEDAFPSFLIGARGQRAGLHMLMENLESGPVTTDQIQRLLKSVGSHPNAKELEIKLDAEGLKTTHAWMLRWLNEYVEIAKRPTWQWYEPLLELDDRLEHQAPPLARMLLPDPNCLPERFQHSHDGLRCALTGVAVERYRLAHHDWPPSLETLVGNYLAQVPLNPYIEEPLYYSSKREPTRIQVLICGYIPVHIPCHSDESNAVTRAADRDIAFRLWHPDQRRQLPAAPAPKEAP
jgi:hypothetical protein